MAKTFGVEVLQSDVTDSSGAATAVDVTGLSFVAAVGKTYEFEFRYFVTGSVTTRGITFALQASPTTAATYLAARTSTPTSTTPGTDAVYECGIDAYGTSPAASTGIAATTGVVCVVKGLVTPAATQVIQGRYVPEAVAGTLTIKAGLSHVIWREL